MSDNYYIVSYYSNTVEDEDWNPPRISAVQLAAAITACARIYMYKYISRPDCYYTDTDSAILGSQLPEDEVSSNELGKLKLEYLVKTGVFLAPKSYMLINQDEKVQIKYKGAAKGLVTPEWFVSQYADPSRTEDRTVTSNFIIDWSTLRITQKEYKYRLGSQVGTKREPVYEKSVWVDTKPKNVRDLCNQDITIHKLLLKCIQDKYDLDRKLLTEKNQESGQRIASLE